MLTLVSMVSIESPLNIDTIEPLFGFCDKDMRLHKYREVQFTLKKNWMWLKLFQKDVTKLYHTLRFSKRVTS